jgi:hypothetical protein
MPPAYLLGPEVAPVRVHQSGGWFCLGKARHNGPQIAYNISKGRNRRGRATRLRAVRSYRCARCHYWHLGGTWVRRPPQID